MNIAVTVAAERLPAPRFRGAFGRGPDYYLVTANGCAVKICENPLAYVIAQRTPCISQVRYDATKQP